MLIEILAWNSGLKFWPEISARNSGLEFWPEISARNSGLKFRLEILAWNSRPKFSARFFQARISGQNFGPGPEILAWPEISARR